MSKNTKTFYHCTPEKNIKNILANELKPRIGKHSSLIGESTPQIYLFNSKMALSDGLSTWFGELFDETEKLTIIKIKLNINNPNLTYQKDSYESLYNQSIHVTRNMTFTESTF